MYEYMALGKLGVKMRIHIKLRNRIRFKCLELSTPGKYYRFIVDMSICADFEWFEVKVSVILLGVEGFSTCRDGS